MVWIRSGLTGSLLFLFLFESIFGQAEATLPRVPPVDAQRAERTFQTATGFRVRLIACEPLVTDPVDLAYDESGRAYVAEMRDYPRADAADGQPAGRIRVLRDTDGDGVFDRSVVFASGLHWPTSVAPWRGGVFVLAPPDLWYLKDVDGDDRADVRRRIVTGFGTFNVQAVANNLKWGPDCRYYGAGSGNGGVLKLPDGTSMTLTRRDFSFDPRTLSFRIESGSGRFGNCFDDEGNRYICNIRNPIIQIVVDRRYLDRNPVTALESGLHDVAASGDQVPVFPASRPEPWRLLRARRWALDPRGIPRSELVGTGFFTSACGLCIYRGDQLGEATRGQAFVCEVAYNLVHREALLREGVTYRSVRVDEGSEIVRSTDNWFRPVNLVNAPDGTLHIVDMYREIIEHPWSIPEDLLKQLDLSSGSDRGRIYRLEPEGFTCSRIRWPGNVPTSELVELLASPSAWWSETAQRLLIERADKRALEPLQVMARCAESPRARVLALWTLERLGWLSKEVLQRALQDETPVVRRHAVRIAEGYLGDANLRQRVRELAYDVDARVRFQVALTAGEFPRDTHVVDLLGDLAMRDGADPWFARAIASSSKACAGNLAERLLRERPETRRARRELLTLLLRTAARVETPARTAGLLKECGELPVGEGIPLAAAMVRELPAAGRRDPAVNAVLLTLRKRAEQLLAARGAVDVRAVLELLTAAGDYASARTLLLETAQSNDSIAAAAAIERIGAYGSRQAGRDLLRLWYEGSNRVRNLVMLQLMRRTPWRAMVLDEIEAGRMPVDAVPALYWHVMMGPQGGNLAQRARQVFEKNAALPPGRSGGEKLEEYVAAVATREGNAQRGLEVFRRECAACHRLKGEGNAIGPDLSSVQRRTPEEILLHILEPNREVAPEFVQYLVSTSTGQLISGAIERESGEAITLITQDGARHTILRSQIEAIQPLGVSLMPEGFADRISPQEMADLLAFILNAIERPARGSEGAR